MISTGDYIRNKYGIAKVIKAETKNGIYIVQLDKDIAFIFDTKAKKEIKRTNILPITEDVNLSKLKISPNIIDLIEEGDVITLTSKYCEGDIYKVDGAFHNGISVSCIGDGSMFIKNDSDIKTVITKEQIKQIEYKVSDDNE